MKPLPKVTQRYVFSKIATFDTLSAMPLSQSSIGNWPFLKVFGNPKSDWNFKLAYFHLYLSFLTIKFWLSPLKFSKLQTFSLICVLNAFSKYYNFWERLLGGNGVFAHWVRVYRAHLWRVINPKVQTVSDWKSVFFPFILRWIAGRNLRKIWDGGLHSLDDLTWN